MKLSRYYFLIALDWMAFAVTSHAEPCTKKCSECCPASAPCCPKANCNQVCKDCCQKDDACCSAKTGACSSTGSVPLERGGKKISPFADKGTPRRY